MSNQVTSPQITAIVGETQIGVAVSSGGLVPITAAVGETPIGVNVVGGGGRSLAGATDVAIDSIAEGDVLRYASGKWRNYAEMNLVDGGNW